MTGAKECFPGISCYLSWLSARTLYTKLETNTSFAPKRVFFSLKIISQSEICSTTLYVKGNALFVEHFWKLFMTVGFVMLASLVRCTWASGGGNSYEPRYGRFLSFFAIRKSKCQVIFSKVWFTHLKILILSVSLNSVILHLKSWDNSKSHQEN